MLIVDKGSIYCKFFLLYKWIYNKENVLYQSNILILRDASSHSQQHLIYNTNINIKRGGARKPNKSL